MKKTIIALAIILATSTVAMAQTKTPVQQSQKSKMTPAQKAVEYSTELKKKLSLTDDQYNKVLAVNTECITRKEAAKASGQKDAHKDISAYRKQQFATILTADQLSKLQAMDAQHAGGQHGQHLHNKMLVDTAKAQ